MEKIKTTEVTWVNNFLNKFASKIGLAGKANEKLSPDKITKLSFEEAERIGLVKESAYMGWKMYKDSGILDSGSIWILESDDQGNKFLTKQIDQTGNIIRKIKQSELYRKSSLNKKANDIIFSREIDTEDGRIKATVEYNDFWKKYQYYVDGSLMGEFDNKEDAINNLENEFPDFLFKKNNIKESKIKKSKFNLSDYKLNKKVIKKRSGKEPGKFEGEPDYLDYMWEQSLDGGGDNEIVFGESEMYVGMIFSDEDKQKFPDIKNDYGIIMYETDSGFVNQETFETKESYDKQITDLETQSEKYNEEWERDNYGEQKESSLNKKSNNVTPVSKILETMFPKQRQQQSINNKNKENADKGFDETLNSQMLAMQIDSNLDKLQQEQQSELGNKIGIKIKAYEKDKNKLNSILEEILKFDFIKQYKELNDYLDNIKTSKFNLSDYKLNKKADIDINDMGVIYKILSPNGGTINVTRFEPDKDDFKILDGDGRDITIYDINKAVKEREEAEVEWSDIIKNNNTDELKNANLNKKAEYKLIIHNEQGASEEVKGNDIDELKSELNNWSDSENLKAKITDEGTEISIWDGESWIDLFNKTNSNLNLNLNKKAEEKILFDEYDKDHKFQIYFTEQYMDKNNKWISGDTDYVYVWSGNDKAEAEIKLQEFRSKISEPQEGEFSSVFLSELGEKNSGYYYKEIPSISYQVEQYNKVAKKANKKNLYKLMIFKKSEEAPKYNTLEEAEQQVETLKTQQGGKEFKTKQSETDPTKFEVVEKTALKKKADLSQEFPVGSFVVPLRKQKRQLSSWTSNFGGGKSYEIIGYDELDGEELLVLKTGEDADNYELVYPDEISLLKKSFLNKKAEEINYNVMEYMIEQAEKDKEWAEETKNNKEWMENASEVSKEMLQNFLEKTIEQLARESYDYLKYRAYAKEDNWYIDPVKKRLWEELTGEKLASLNKKAEGESYGVTILITGQNKKTVDDAIEILQGMDMNKYGVNISVPTNITQSGERGYTISFIIDSMSAEQLDEISKTFSDLEHELGTISVEIGAKVKGSEKGKEEKPKEEKKEPEKVEPEKAASLKKKAEMYTDMELISMSDDEFSKFYMDFFTNRGLTPSNKSLDRELMLKEIHDISEQELTANLKKADERKKGEIEKEVPVEIEKTDEVSKEEAKDQLSDKGDGSDTDKLKKEVWEESAKVVLEDEIDIDKATDTFYDEIVERLSDGLEDKKISQEEYQELIKELDALDAQDVLRNDLMSRIDKIMADDGKKDQEKSKEKKNDKDKVDNKKGGEKGITPEQLEIKLPSPTDEK